MVDPKPTRAVDDAADELRRRILRREYAAGTRLPPERELSVTLGVSRLTLRAAVARLEAEGLVAPRRGDGVHVLDYATAGTFDLIRYLVTDDPSLIAEFLELRRTVGAEAVALAAARATEEQIARLSALAELQQKERSATKFRARDLEFGRTILEMANNLPMRLMLNTVEQVYLDHPTIAAALHADREAVRRSYVGVVALVAAGDPAMARTAVIAALEQIDRSAIEKLASKRKRRRSSG